MLPGNRFTSKLKYTGDRNIASCRGDIRFACVQDRGCRYWGTAHFAGTRAFRSLGTGAKMHGGVLEQVGGLGFAFKQFAQYLIFQQLLHTLQKTLILE